MNKKVIYGVIALIVLLIVAGVIYTQSNQQINQQESLTPEDNSEMLTEEVSNFPVTSEEPEMVTPQTNQSSGRFSGEDDIMAPDIIVHEVSFSGSAFSPANLTIKNGDIVVFKNNSSKDFWPASAPHPQHTDYPEFDPKKRIAPGGTYEFKFTKTGAWGFHDHITPSAFGKITVQ